MTSKINTSELYYDLPEKNIKQNPYTERDSSLILNVHNKEISKFADIYELLPKNSMLILNKSTVHKVRISAKNMLTGSLFEIFILNILDENSFECLLKSNSSKKIGTTLIAGIYEMVIQSRVKNVFKVSILNTSCENLISKYGTMPLPPYIKDNQNKYKYYQSEFAEGGFSTAAPTAGLHFTKTLLNELEEKGITVKYVLLDVGIGTFQPIKTEFIEDHLIHQEKYYIESDVIKEIQIAKKKNTKIICVGTTTLRAIETAFQSIPPKKSGVTDLFIKRGYQFKIADGLITNFHAPKSSLIAIVDAILGKEWKNIYTYALESNMNFLSFGDSMYTEINKCKT